MSLNHFLEHIEPIEISGGVAQAVGLVAKDYDPMTTVTWLAEASLRDGVGSFGSCRAEWGTS